MPAAAKSSILEIKPVRTGPATGGEQAGQRKNNMRLHATKLKLTAGLWLLAWLASQAGAGAAPAPADLKKFEPRYHALFLNARTNWARQPDSVSNAWVLARAAFDLAEFATNNTQRAQLAVEGIDAARSALRLDAQCGAAHYHLAMNLGQLARTQLLGALKLVGEMEEHFTLAAKLDPLIDHAGPDRNLGILYREAPGWPASIGSRHKARQHLKKAAELAPGFPANQLELLKSHLKWKETAAAEKLAQQIETALPRARQEFTGAEWELWWTEWTPLWKELREEVGKAKR